MSHGSFFTGSYVTPIELRDRKRGESGTVDRFPTLSRAMRGYCPRWGRAARLRGAEPRRTPPNAYRRAPSGGDPRAPGPRRYDGDPSGGTHCATSRTSAAGASADSPRRPTTTPRVAPPTTSAAASAHRTRDGCRDLENGFVGLRGGVADRPWPDALDRSCERLAHRVLTDRTGGLRTV